MSLRLLPSVEPEEEQIATLRESLAEHGLKFQPKTAAVEYLIVDKVNKIPMDN